MMTIEAIGVRLVAVAQVVNGVTLFLGSDPNLPSTASGFLTVVESPGFPTVRGHNTTPDDRPSFQITARAKDFAVAAALLKKARTALDGVNVVWGDVFFLYVRSGTPFGMPPDDAGRARRSFNIDTYRRGQE